MTLALDATASATATTATSKAITLTTVAANTVAVVMVLTNTNATGVARTVSSVTATGLTFTKRGSISQNNSLSDAQNLEWWWAPVASAGAHAITVTLSGAPDLTSLIAFSVSGANTTTPWDTASTNGFSAGNATATATVVQVTGVSTTAAAAFGFSFTAIDGNVFASFPCATGAYTEILDVNNSNNTWGNLGGCYEAYSSAQSSFTMGYKTGVTFDSASKWVAMFDAIVAGGGGGGTRTPTLTLMGVG